MTYNKNNKQKISSNSVSNHRQTRLCLSLAIGLSTIFTLSACSKKTDTPTPDTAKTSISTDDALKNPDSLYILAGSELQDIEPFLGDIKAKTGVTLKLDYTGTIDGAEAIAQGKKVDGAWFSHGKYLSLINGKQIITQNPIMLSPVVLGVKQSKAQQFGWLAADGKTAKPDLTWQSIADKANSGELKYAMTNPASSNSGFTALMGVVSAFAGTSDAPTEADIQKAQPKLKDFFKGQALTAGSSGWLADAFVKNSQTVNNLDGMINYESVLLQLNQSGKLKEPLVLLYPKEGIITADYPLMLLNASKQTSYDKVVTYLKSPEFQTKLMTQTFRRPVNSSVKLAPSFNQAMLMELPFPNAKSVINTILGSYMNELRLPARPIFVIDTSGSMTGDGITQLKNALTTLNDGDGTAMGDFAKFAEREQITFIPFDSSPNSPQQFSITGKDNTAREPIRQFINGLDVGGGTAIFSSLHTAYQRLEGMQPQNGKQQYYATIVLMTDGQNTNGESFDEFQAFYNSLPANVKNVKTFTVLFGDADPTEMQKIADLTGGKVFDGRKDSLASVFKQIRGYQ